MSDISDYLNASDYFIEHPNKFDWGNYCKRFSRHRRVRLRCNGA